MTANDNYEQEIWAQGYKYVGAVDESGMGSLAGDVFVGAVIMPINIDYKLLLPKINDSKKLTHVQRGILYDLIKAHAISYSVATASIDEIDVYNIYWARFIAARRAISMLKIKPDYVLMDGNAKIPDIDVEQMAIVKGDSKSISIAAASILAKVSRDRYMIKIAGQVHSDYGWINNKAYYSKGHVKALADHGKTKWHRAKFIKKFAVLGEDNGNDKRKY